MSRAAGIGILEIVCNRSKSLGLLGMLAVLTLLPSLVRHRNSHPGSNGGFGTCLVFIEGRRGGRLLIVDSGFNRESGALGGLYVVSLRNGLCTARMVHGIQPLSSNKAAVLLQSGSHKRVDLAYLAGFWEGGSRTRVYLVQTCILGGKEYSRTFLEGVTAGSTTAMWLLGDVDGQPGDELFIRYAYDIADDSAQQRPVGAVVVSASSGEVIRSVFADRIIMIGDLDNDQVPDYIVVRDDVFGVHSGKTGLALETATKLIASLTSAESHAGYRTVADHDGDGVRDLLRVVSDQDPEKSVSQIALVSGATGAEVWDVEGLCCLGYSSENVASMADQDGDSIADIAVTSGGTGVGVCEGWRVYSGATGELIVQQSWPPVEAPLGGDALLEGYAVVGVGDVDSDGVADLAISQSTDMAGQQAGIVRLYSTEKGLIRELRRADL